MNTATLPDGDLLAAKRDIEARRKVLMAQVDALRREARPITAEQFRRKRRTMLLARLRNNLEPKAAELAFLAALTDAEVLAIDAEATASVDACMAKNPDWRPASRRRRFDLLRLVRQAREAVE